MLIRDDPTCIPTDDDFSFTIEEDEFRPIKSLQNVCNLSAIFTNLTRLADCYAVLVIGTILRPPV
jgi:hypothetical protein